MLHSATLFTINYYFGFLLSTFFVSCIKGLFVFTAIFIITRKYRNLPPEYLHILWLFTLCSFILIPLLTLFMPINNFEVFTSFTKKSAAYRALTFLSSPKFKDLNTAVFFAAPETALSKKVMQTPHYKHYMPMFLFFIWFTGAFLSLLNIITGRIILFKFLRDARPIDIEKPVELQKWTPVIKQLSERIGLKRSILVLKSRQCKLPFTCCIFKPVIVLPQDIDTWSLYRGRAVLLHELVHIKRRDYLTKLISRTICALYWFMPPAWIAYYKLMSGQEETCDSIVIKTGEKPADYAKCIIDFARMTKNRVPLSGAFLSSSGKRLTERRILHLLLRKNRGSPALFKHLWTVPVLCFFVLFLFLSVNPAVSGQYEKLYGTWTNKNYNETSWHYALQIFNPDGTFAVYENTYDSKPKLYGKLIITDCWTDAEGSTWIFGDEYVGMYFKGKKVSQYTLHKISKSGDTLERVLRSSKSGRHHFEPEIYLSEKFNQVLYRQ